MKDGFTPYKNKETQREYCRQWVARRRAAWFSDKICAECGSDENLELDHVDPSQKVDHKIWSWSEQRRQTELAKCQPLCGECHEKKTSAFNSARRRGKPNLWNRKFSCDQVAEIRLRAGRGERLRRLGRVFGVSHGTIGDIVQNRTYTDIAVLAPIGRAVAL